jgi:hypothetical protein
MLTEWQWDFLPAGKLSRFGINPQILRPEEAQPLPRRHIDKRGVFVDIFFIFPGILSTFGQNL